MSNSLRSEIITPVHSYTYRVVATAVGLGIAAIVLPAGPTSVTPPAPTPIVQEVLATVPMPMVASIEQPPGRSNEVLLVFRAAGATYMKLGDAAEAMPAHGALKLYDRGEIDQWQKLSIGTIAEPDLPLAYRRWIDKAVTVDGDCTTTVTGFAVVARLTGDPSYAEVDTSTWTADNVLAQGAPVVAARLAGCKTGMLARDAALSPIVTPIVIRDTALAARARAELLASSRASDAQRAWEADDRKGRWHAQESAAIHTIVVRHPTTDTVWVSVHARVEEGCGGPDINIWGLYRVDGDELVTAQQRDLGELHSIAKLVDLEGDGELELIGAPWLGTDTIVTRASGDEITHLALPFYGCAC